MVVEPIRRRVKYGSLPVAAQQQITWDELDAEERTRQTSYKSLSDKLDGINARQNAILVMLATSAFGFALNVVLHTF